MNNSPLLAYHVREETEERSALVFACSSDQAAQRGANKLEVLASDVTCSPAPEFDQYAPGPVPMDALLRADWEFECGNCEKWFGGYGRIHPTEDEEEPEFAPVEIYGGNYCCPTCAGLWIARHTAYVNQTNAIIEACATHWPMATAIQAWVDGSGNARTRFSIPGLQHQVWWRVGDTTVNAADMDIPAYIAATRGYKAVPTIKQATSH